MQKEDQTIVQVEKIETPIISVEETVEETNDEIECEGCRMGSMDLNDHMSHFGCCHSPDMCWFCLQD